MQDERVKISILGIKITIKNPFKSQNNQIILYKNNVRKKINFVKGLKVKFYGANNTIEFINKIPKLKNVKIDCGNNTNITIAESKHTIKNLYINARATNANVHIAKDFSIESGIFDMHGESNTKIEIGEDCQFGSNIELDTADGHVIFDNNTKEVLNKPKSIIVQSHVWLCRNVSILKGSIIPKNSVVAKTSIVTKALTNENCIYAGIPAKTVKENINWSRKSYEQYI